MLTTRRSIGTCITIIKHLGPLRFRFPATMVDRITPSIGDEHREILAKDFGVLDTWPVVSEVFRQWVIEVGYRLQFKWLFQISTDATVRP